MNKNPNLLRTSIFLDKIDMAELKVYADRKETSLSRLVRKAIKEYLKKISKMKSFQSKVNN